MKTVSKAGKVYKYHRASIVGEKDCIYDFKIFCKTRQLLMYPEITKALKKYMEENK